MGRKRLWVERVGGWGCLSREGGAWKQGRASPAPVSQSCLLLRGPLPDFPRAQTRHGPAHSWCVTSLGRHHSNFRGPLADTSPLLCHLEAVDLGKHIFDLILQLLWVAVGEGQEREGESGGGSWDRRGFTTLPTHSHPGVTPTLLSPDRSPSRKSPVLKVPNQTASVYSLSSTIS